ncbi:hypothetical protein AYO20_04846 [Fonsecaea nubica]|uniref:Protein kinase domain-containing protein n=1 Tax=Fonsecaea nubica TaxID=856822 RepID=A0A178D1A0_9EURO|nr:hypothetical protein AYO20_04846 [Fonsecaea nubica]OAL35940.1 hypothetical protein AYO20_04846 [Fonsecaea nubica]
MSQKPCLKSRPLPPLSTVEGLDCLDVGKSANVYALDNERVVKRYDGGNDEEVRAERIVYDRLGHHPNIAEFLGALDDGSIVLERGQVLRAVLAQQQTGPDTIPLRTKYRWVQQAATGLQHLHDHGIIQADVGCRNMIVVDGTLKLINFEGCSIDGEGPRSSYEWFSYKPSTPRATVQTDIFALGCAMYEIMTGKPPYYEFKGTENAREHVERLYEANQFPDVARLPLGQVISDCWRGKFNSMREVMGESGTIHIVAEHCRRSSHGGSLLGGE